MAKQTEDIKVSENNGLFQKKNFDIEIFEIEEEDQDGTKIETLRSLSFSSDLEVTSAVDGVVSESTTGVPSDEDPTHVDYYFDIFVDDEMVIYHGVAGWSEEYIDQKLVEMLVIDPE